MPVKDIRYLLQKGGHTVQAMYRLRNGRVVDGTDGSPAPRSASGCGCPGKGNCSCTAAALQKRTAGCKTAVVMKCHFQFGDKGIIFFLANPSFEVRSSSSFIVHRSSFTKNFFPAVRLEILPDWEKALLLFQKKVQLKLMK
jgi:hypothetical protein